MVSIKLYSSRRLVLCSTAGMVQSCATLHAETVGAETLSSISKGCMQDSKPDGRHSPCEDVYNPCQLVKAEI